MHAFLVMSIGLAVIHATAASTGESSVRAARVSTGDSVIHFEAEALAEAIQTRKSIPLRGLLLQDDQPSQTFLSLRASAPLAGANDAEQAGAPPKIVVGNLSGPDRPLAFDPARFILLTGSIEGIPGSFASIAASEDAVAGFVHLGIGGRTYRVLPLRDHGSNGALTGRLVAVDGGALSPDVPLCGVGTDGFGLRVLQSPGVRADEAGGQRIGRVGEMQVDDGLGDEASHGPEGPDTEEPGHDDPPESEPNAVGELSTRVIEIAIDTDYEYYALFNDPDAAAA